MLSLAHSTNAAALVTAAGAATTNPMSDSARRNRRPAWVSRDPELCLYPYQGRRDDIDPTMIAANEADNAQAEAHYTEQARVAAMEREEAELQAA
jgi:hypothetical protein